MPAAVVFSALDVPSIPPLFLAQPFFFCAAKHLTYIEKLPAAHMESKLNAGKKPSLQFTQGPTHRQHHRFQETRSFEREGTSSSRDGNRGPKNKQQQKKERKPYNALPYHFPAVKFISGGCEEWRLPFAFLWRSSGHDTTPWCVVVLYFFGIGWIFLGHDVVTDPWPGPGGGVRLQGPLWARVNPRGKGNPLVRSVAFSFAVAHRSVYKL